MRWFAGFVVLVAAGLVVQHQTAGPDRWCPDGSVFGIRDYAAGAPGEISPDAALDAAGWRGGDRVTEERGSTGDAATLIYRAYDEDDELLRVVEVERHRQGWYVDTDETCA